MQGVCLWYKMYQNTLPCDSPCRGKNSQVVFLANIFVAQIYGNFVPLCTKFQPMKTKTNRVHNIHFRLTESEMIQLSGRQREAGYYSRSKYIRALIFSHKNKIEMTPGSDAHISLHTQELRDIHKEINRIGQNYNQVVRSINAAAQADKYPSAYVLKRLDELHQMTAQVMDIQKLLLYNMEQNK